jgi:hypothetical protein
VAQTTLGALTYGFELIREKQLIVPFLGFTFLLAAFFPLAPQLLQLAGISLFASVFKSSPAAFHLLTLVITYAPAALVTAWFFSSANLKNRLPSPVPGTTVMLAGVALTLVFVVARLLASTIPGGGPSFLVGQLGPLVVWPARILLVIGAVRLLLAARAT